MHLITYSYTSASGTFPTKSRLQIKTFLYASPPFLQGSTKRSALWSKMMEKRIFGRRVEKRAIWTLIKDLFQVANLKWSSLVSNKLPSLFSGQIVGRHTTRGKDAIRGEKIQFFQILQRLSDFNFQLQKLSTSNCFYKSTFCINFQSSFQWMF